MVYFEGKRPLFAETGNHPMHFFARLEQLSAPDHVIQDYEDVHGFLHEITTDLEPDVQAFFEQVAVSTDPGYEVKKKRITRILPDTIVMSFFQGARYDDEWKVEW